MDLNTFKQKCGHLHCTYCSLEIDIDSPTVCFVYAPNIAKIATTMKGVEVFDRAGKEVFCTGRCLILHNMRLVAEGGS